ncbi:MAG: RNA polymerase sigma factor [Bacteroidota bacterium]
MNDNDDTYWIQQAKAGHREGYRSLYERHVDGLFQFLMQFSDDRPRVEDWVQQAFSKAFQKLDQFDGQSRFKTWLWKIGINEMRMELRLKKNQVEKTPFAEEEHNRERLPPATLITLHNQINQLDPRKRLVLLLYEVEGYSHREIADLLEIGESSSRTLLSRTKAELRKQIGEFS